MKKYLFLIVAAVFLMGCKTTSAIKPVTVANLPVAQQVTELKKEVAKQTTIVAQQQKQIAKVEKQIKAVKKQRNIVVVLLAIAVGCVVYLIKKPSIVTVVIKVLNTVKAVVVKVFGFIIPVVKKVLSWLRVQYIILRIKLAAVFAKKLSDSN